MNQTDEDGVAFANEEDSIDPPAEPEGATKAKAQAIRSVGTEFIAAHTKAAPLALPKDESGATGASGPEEAKFKEEFAIQSEAEAENGPTVEVPKVCVDKLAVSQLGALAEHIQSLEDAWTAEGGGADSMDGGLTAEQFAAFYEKVGTALPKGADAGKALAAKQCMKLKNRALASVVHDPSRSKVSWLEFWVYQCNNGAALPELEAANAPIPTELAAKLYGAKAASGASGAAGAEKAGATGAAAFRRSKK